jgi:transcriptional regulator GlxA family with amidase domain
VREALELDLGSNHSAGQLFGSCVVDALAAAIEWELAGQAALQRGQSALFETVKAYVLSNLGNRGIDASRLAAQHGISVRTLNRLFAAHGTTPMRWVWSQRLRACYEALERGGAQVIRVAFAHGFADPSHFSRAFKTTYGISPREVSRLPKPLS